MKPSTVQARNDAYKDILQYGLMAIRDSARRNNIRLAELEADHIHNLPSLIDEPNEARHHSYLFQERPYYLDRLKDQVDVDCLRFTHARYREAWAVLESIAKPETV